jgi:hypothetical protein
MVGLLQLRRHRLPQTRPLLTQEQKGGSEASPSITWAPLVPLIHCLQEVFACALALADMSDMALLISERP